MIVFFSHHVLISCFPWVSLFFQNYTKKTLQAFVRETELLNTFLMPHCNNLNAVLSVNPNHIFEGNACIMQKIAFFFVMVVLEAN